MSGLAGRYLYDWCFLLPQERAKLAKSKSRTTKFSSTKVIDLNHGEDEGVGVLDNLLEALHSGSALQPASR